MQKLDQYDIKILNALSKDGRLSITNLADQIGLSKTPTQIRLNKLEKAKFIKGYYAAIDPIKLGLDHIAFVEVRLSDTRENALNQFNQAVLAIPEIEEAHMIAANFDYLLKIRTKNMNDFRQILGTVISALPHVASTSSFMSMQAIKENNAGENLPSITE